MKRYVLLLLATVLVSYGQIINMGVWKDDNAIFFKFTHINEPAGFFGVGLLGQGPYRFSVMPYWFIYQIVGYRHIWAYYLLILFFYFLIAYLVYKVFSRIISPLGGKVAGLLFAAGYIASEGYFWLANAMLANVSMVTDLLLLLSYYFYHHRKRLIFYLLAVSLYWFVSYLVPIRNYYFISVIVIFEFMHINFKNFPKAVVVSSARLIPFGLIFYRYFLSQLDSRANSLQNFFISVIKGEVYLTQGFLSSSASLIFPDWITFWLFRHNSPRTIILFTSFIFLAAFYLILRKEKRGWLKIVLFGLTSVVWIILSKNFYDTPVLVLTPERLFFIRLGGLILLLALAILLSLSEKYKRQFFFLFSWFVLSIAGYTFYEPKAYLGTTHRYFAHSLVPLVGALAVIFVSVDKKSRFWHKLVCGMIICWGVVNLASSVVYQNEILEDRSIPVRNFYRQLGMYLDKVNTGDVFYFDVATDASGYYSDAFKVSSMPNETAIAWRYEVDRNDLRLFDNFNEFSAWVFDNDLSKEQIHSFFYSKEGLFDTSDQTWNYLKSEEEFKKVEVNVQKSGNELIITFDTPIISIVPVELELSISAKPKDVSQINFPYISDAAFLSNKVATDSILRASAFRYQEQQARLMSNTKPFTNNVWFKDVADHLTDGNLSSVWRSHRVLWSQEKTTNLVFDMLGVVAIDGFVWHNAYSNNSPTKYRLEVSSDNQNWEVVYETESLRRIEPNQMQIIRFDPQNTRYIKMTIFSTLSNDSPGIAEVWVVPAGFGNLSINETEMFLDKPFGYIPDEQSYLDTLNRVGYIGESTVYWVDNQKKEWTTVYGSTMKLLYDSTRHLYKVYVPARGTKVEKIKISDTKIPGEMEITSVRYRHP